MNLDVLNSFTSFHEIYVYYTKLTKEYSNDKITKFNETLIELLEHLCTEVDLFTKPHLLTLLVVYRVDKLGRGSEIGCTISRDYLTQLYKWYSDITKDFIQFCDPYLPKTPHLVIPWPCMPYRPVIESMIEELNTAEQFPIKGDLRWLMAYLIISAIFHKEERHDTEWLKAFKIFFSNSQCEDMFEKVPGISYNDKGVRHDMLCPVRGTSDPDFYYEPGDGHKYSAEFKRPTGTVDSLADYAFKQPKYIYYADFLFSYGPSLSGEVGFYKIDYTKKNTYTIEKIEVADYIV